MATQGHQTAHEHGGEGRMCYVFGDCELDAARCELRCASKTVLVEPKIFKVLAYLIAHRDRVVHKDELLASFWPGTFMSESALTHCLTKVRKAVHDDNVSQCVIKTVRGYFQDIILLAPRPA